MDINAKMAEVLQQALPLLSKEVQESDDFKKFVEKVKELVNDAVPWYLK